MPIMDFRAARERFETRLAVGSARAQDRYRRTSRYRCRADRRRAGLLQRVRLNRRVQLVARPLAGSAIDRQAASDRCEPEKSEPAGHIAPDHDSVSQPRGWRACQRANECDHRLLDHNGQHYRLGWFRWRADYLVWQQYQLRQRDGWGADGGFLPAVRPKGARGGLV